MVGLDVHGEVPLAAEGLVADVTGISCVRVTLLLVYRQIILSSELHPTRSTHELTVLSLVTLLDMSPQPEPGVEHLLTEVALEVDVELTVDLVFVLDAGVHVPEGVVAHVAGESCREAVGGVVVSDGLVVLLELPVTEEAVVHRHLVRGVEPHQAAAVHVVRVEVGLLQLHPGGEGGESGGDLGEAATDPGLLCLPLDWAGGLPLDTLRHGQRQALHLVEEVKDGFTVKDRADLLEVSQLVGGVDLPGGAGHQVHHQLDRGDGELPGQDDRLEGVDPEDGLEEGGEPRNDRSEEERRGEELPVPTHQDCVAELLAAGQAGQGAHQDLVPVLLVLDLQDFIVWTGGDP